MKPRLQEILSRIRTIELKALKAVRNFFAGEYKSAYKSVGLEFDEVRPYQYGDDVRTIDWNVTARTGQTHIKVFREERELSVFILFDISGSEDFGTANGQKLLTGTELTAMLAMSALQNNDRVGLAAFTEIIEYFRPPAKSRRHVLALIDTLLRLEPTCRTTRIDIALDFIRNILPRRAIVFLISDFLDTGFETNLARLSFQHEITLIRLFHPDEILTEIPGFLPVIDAETNQLRWLSRWGYQTPKIAARFEHLHLRLKHLANKYQMGYLSIDVTQDYFPILQHFFLTRGELRNR